MVNVFYVSKFCWNPFLLLSVETSAPRPLKNHYISWWVYGVWDVRLSLDCDKRFCDCPSPVSSVAQRNKKREPLMNSKFMIVQKNCWSNMPVGKQLLTGCIWYVCRIGAWKWSQMTNNYSSSSAWEGCGSTS